MIRHTLLLKIVVFLIGIPLTAFVFGYFPYKAITDLIADPDPSWWGFFLAVVVYGTAVPFLLALREGYRLLGMIDRGEAFSDHAIRVLRNIRIDAAAIGILYAVCMPFFFFIAEADDAPGVAAIALAVMTAAFTVAVFAAVFAKLLAAALDLKREHDLTV